MAIVRKTEFAFSRPLPQGLVLPLTQTPFPARSIVRLVARVPAGLTVLGTGNALAPPATVGTATAAALASPIKFIAKVCPLQLLRQALAIMVYGLLQNVAVFVAVLGIPLNL